MLMNVVGLIVSSTWNSLSTTMSSSSTTIPKVMKAVGLEQFGDAEQIRIEEIPVPRPKEKEILIKIHATAINRADILQRGGSYAPPPGASTVMGLECVGEVAEIGSGATKFQVGQRVMALLSGGGYAQYTTVDEGSAMEIPDHLSYQHAAAIPEVFLTAYLISRQLGGLAKDDVALIHAGASGVGTALIQLCKLFGAHAIVTVGSESKAEFCKKLGAEHAINYKTEANFSASVKEFCSTLSPKRDGASLLLDPVGATHAKENLESLGQDARWILYGTMGGANVDNFPIGQILRKRIRLEGSTLRARSLAFKANLIENFRRECLDQFDPSKGSLKPIIEATFPLTHMRQAHELMESNSTVGKIVITVEH